MADLSLIIDATLSCDDIWYITNGFGICFDVANHITNANCNTHVKL